MAIDGEKALRLAAFLGILAAVGLWETLAPRRARSFPRVSRWPSNLGIVALDAVLVRILLPVGLVGVAEWARAKGWGLFNAAEAPAWVAGFVSFVALDFVIWAQHVVFHRVPALWRLHRMHHADLDYDVTTSLRFHPLEILISLAIKAAAILALGAPAVAVAAFEIALNGFAMFNHANAALPPRVEKFARWLFVTPDMHRVHHSVEVAETNSNFGFNLSLWDRLFRVYRAAPKDGQGGMTVGLPAFREEGELRLDRMLTQPWRKG